MPSLPYFYVSLAEHVRKNDDAKKRGQLISRVPFEIPLYFIMFRAIMYKLYSDTGYDGDFDIVQNIQNYKNNNKQLIIMYK